MLALAIGGCQGARPAGTPDAAPIRVVTSGGFAAAFNLLAPRFEQTHGTSVITRYGSSSGGAVDSIPSRLARGEAFDVVILADYSLDNLIVDGFVARHTRVKLVRSRIGMAVKAGARVPNISSPVGFIDTLRNAKSIGYSASASGTYLSTQLLPRLGLWAELEPKSVRILSKRVAASVADGEVEIGFQQISEILPIPGITYAGPIPDEYQKTTTFSAAITRSASNSEGARRLLAFLSSREAAAAILATGLSPVVLETPDAAAAAGQGPVRASSGAGR